MKRPIFSASIGLPPRHRLLPALIVLTATLVFALMVGDVVHARDHRFDDWAFRNLASITSNGTTDIMETITFFGSAQFLLPAYIVLCICLLFARRRVLAINVAVVGLTSTAALHLLKLVFHRSRPVEPIIHGVTGYSFPSGHSFSSFTFFAVLTYLVALSRLPAAIKWLTGVIFFLCAACIAVSRVYLHVHYASDVVGGFCLAIIWTGLSFFALHRIESSSPATLPPGPP